MSNNSDIEFLLTESRLDQLIDQWLAEDIPSFDYGAAVVGSRQNQAHLYCKSPGVLAGIPFVNQILTKRMDCSIEWLVKEGQWLEGGEGNRVLVAIIKGPAYKILQAERVVLNLLARCSGIATLGYRLLQIQRRVRWQGYVAGTRKTTPGFRLVEKYGMLVGGVDTHRMDLSSMVMLKDNHIWSCGSIGEAVKSARSIAGFSLKIEVECRNEDEAWQAADAGADVVMLDHFSAQQAADCAARLKQKHPSLLVELSGGITEHNIECSMLKGIDVISMGSLTQGYQVVDYSLKIQPN